MKTNPLTEEAYQATMLKMVNITETATPDIDIWPYVKQLVNEGVVAKYFYNGELVKYVFRSEGELFDHVLLPTSNENAFIVIVVDLKAEGIYGHYVLDLAKKYGFD